MQRPKVQRRWSTKLESETDLQKRIKELGIKVAIKDDAKNCLYYFDARINEKQFKTMSRYNRN